VGIDAKNTVKIWNWAQGKMIASVAGHNERVFDISYSGDQVITCGVKHIRFWTLLGNTLQPTEGQFGKSEVQTLLCIGHFPKGETRTGGGDDADLCFTGSISGDIYIWKGRKIHKTIERAHKVSIRPSLSTRNTVRFDV
jgi:echinoderm microtubule-associated protein-like 6